MAEETMHIETNQQDQLATTCETNNGAKSHDNTDISQQICSVDAAAAEAAAIVGLLPDFSSMNLLM